MSRDEEACSDLHTECVAQLPLYTGHRQPCVPPSVLIFIEGTTPTFSTSLQFKLSVTEEKKRGGNDNELDLKLSYGKQ